MNSNKETETMATQVYYAAREWWSNGELVITLARELGEAEPGSPEAQAMIDRVNNSNTGRIVVAAESDVARTLGLGDVVSVDDDGMIVGRSEVA